MTTKPREFWLVEMEGNLEVCSEESAFANTQIHVIEAAPLLAKIARLESELAEAIKEIELRDIELIEREDEMED